MTNEATRLAEEAKRLAFLVPNFADYVLLRDAIDTLATLAQPAVSEDAQRLVCRSETVSEPGAAIKVEVIHLTDAGHAMLTSNLTSAIDSARASSSTAGDAAMASQEKPHD